MIQKSTARPKVGTVKGAIYGATEACPRWNNSGLGSDLSEDHAYRM
jgi:hypothetical protein